MKVKARVKALEHLPEWAKCCEGMISAINADRGKVLIVDLSDTRTRNDHECKWCETHCPSHRVVIDIERDAYLPFDFYDLDEGPMEAQ